MVDILVTVGTAMKFTVNVAALSVPLVTSGTGVIPICERADGAKTFQAGDKIRLLSAAIILPIGFEQYSTYDVQGNFKEILVSFRKVDNTNLQAFVPESYLIPFANYELVIDNLQGYIPLENFRLRAAMNVFGAVSMVNVPAALNGIEFSANIMLKIEHTLPMVTP